MGDRSGIEWTETTWNPVTGCSRVSPGCAHCYALDLAARLKAMGQPKYQRDGGRGSGPGFGVTLHPRTLSEPSRWREPRTVFVNSMSDLFHEEVSFEFIDQVLTTMLDVSRHTYQVLTKRPERLLEWASRLTSEQIEAIERSSIWFGVSIENRRFVYRADLLRAAPAAVRFVSAEPLLGPLADELDLTGVDWLIVGGESGPAARRVRGEWVRDLRHRCIAEQVPFFFKQWGGRTAKAGGRELDGRTWEEMPTPGGRDHQLVFS